MKRRLLIVAWLAVTLLGLWLIGWACRFQYRAGSYLAIPELVGFVGVYITYQGIATTRQIIRRKPPE